MTAAKENLSFPVGTDGNELAMEPVPSRLPRSVSFKDDSVSEMAPAVEGDEAMDEAPRTHDDSALLSFKTYSEKHDNGELARAAKEIALKMERSLLVGSAAESGSEGGPEAMTSAAEVLAELRDLRQRISQLEKAQPVLPPSRRSGLVERSDGSPHDGDEQPNPRMNPWDPNPRMNPRTNPRDPGSVAPPAIETDFEFGNLTGEARAPVADPVPCSSSNRVSLMSERGEAEAGLMAYFTPLATPATTPRIQAVASLDEFFDADSQPSSPRQALLKAAASQLQPHALSLSPPPSPQRLAHLANVSPTHMRVANVRKLPAKALASLTEER
jgi:hypothetical protein